MVSEKYRVRITEEKLNPSDARDFASSERHGATVVFHGVTRNHTDSRRVILLEYEAYIPMAVKKLEEIANEICSKWDVRVAIDHRLGRVDIGEESLVVAVGSPHRQAAFEATGYSVDRIKQTVPIWKKEHFKGGEIWIGDADGFRPLEQKSN
ncbi:MAG: molybdenum cofactor biosynthesis protein MoaE [SAR202 cluster bacterium]|nr:molybdenum cofactor biosynthesis protein MoaE [SAR202 cluster bacterium]|tara:strand:- start:684 stop:1139 length:456 start_codon:yes stop_codon:yes gene_type:complete